MNVPTWVHHMVAINNYHQQCEVHKGSHTTCQFFCITCLSDKALCTRCCKGEDSAHNGHKILQLRRSSRMTVIKAIDIRDTVSIGTIQSVICNSSDVVYVKRFETINIWKNTAYILCLICKHKLEVRHVSDPLFCSIQCMLEHHIRKQQQQQHNNQSRGGSEAQPPSQVIHHQQQKGPNRNVRDGEAPRFDRFQQRKPDDRHDHNNLRNPMDRNRILLPQQEQQEPIEGRSKRTYRRKQPYPQRANMGNTF